MTNRKFYAAHSNYGKCSIDSLNGTAWDKIASFDSKADRDKYGNNNWFPITWQEYNSRKKDIEKYDNYHEIKEKIIHNPADEL